MKLVNADVKACGCYTLDGKVYPCKGHALEAFRKMMGNRNATS